MTLANFGKRLAKMSIDMTESSNKPRHGAPIRRRPTSLADIAAVAGVSVSTVSRIANGELGRASPATVERVQRLIQSLDYRPNPVGRTLRSGDSRIVAMLAPNLDNPAMAAIAASTEAALREAGYVMILCDTHDRSELQDEYLRAMRSRFVEGFVLVSAVASEELETAVRRGDPIVFVNRRCPYGRGAFVGIDNKQAGSDAADFLLEQTGCGLGAGALAVVHPHVLSSTIRDRVEGFLARLAERDADRIVLRVDGDGVNHLDCGYRATRALVAAYGWPAGVMCPSDLMAYGLYRAATEDGVAIPAKCRPIGIDDNALNAWIAPWLASISVPYHAFGKEIVFSLREMWGDRAGARSKVSLLQHELITR